MAQLTRLALLGFVVLFIAISLFPINQNTLPTQASEAESPLFTFTSLDTNLVAYWRMDEWEDDTTADTYITIPGPPPTPGPNTPTPTPTPTGLPPLIFDGTYTGLTWGNGVSTRSLRFDGPNDPSTSSTAPIGAHEFRADHAWSSTIVDLNNVETSYSLWFYPEWIEDQTPDINQILLNIPSKNVQIRLNSNGLLHAHVNPLNPLDGATGVTRVTPREWHHVVLTSVISVTPGDSRATLNLYLDGKLEATNVVQVIETDKYDFSGVVHLGCMGSNVTPTPTPTRENQLCFHGKLDEIRLYKDRILTSSDIERLTRTRALNLQAHWRLDNITTTTLPDSSGNQLTMTRSTGVSTIEGISNDALQFNGTVNQYAVTSANLTMGSRTSVSLWFRPAGTPTNSDQALFTIRSSSGGAGMAIVLNNSKLKGLTDVTSQSSGNLVQGTLGDEPSYHLYDGKWHHVAFTLDPMRVTTGLLQTGNDPDCNLNTHAGPIPTNTPSATPTPNTTPTPHPATLSSIVTRLSLYVDGVLDCTSLVSGSLTISGLVNLARFGNPSGFVTNQAPYNGSIDDVRIYNRVLSHNEISEIHSNWFTELAGFWAMDESNPPTPTPQSTYSSDMSGERRHGTIDGAIRTNGIYGNALHFDGVNDKVTSSHSFSLGNRASFSAWFHISATPTADKALISIPAGGANSSITLMLDNAGKLKGKVQGTSSNGTVVQTSGSVVTGVWHHATLTINGASLELYLDGVPVGSGSVTSTPGGFSGVAQIGYASDITNSYFTGEIDEARIYNRTLTDNEAQRLFEVYLPVEGLTWVPSPTPTTTATPRVIAVTTNHTIENIRYLDNMDYPGYPNPEVYSGTYTLPAIASYGQDTYVAYAYYSGAGINASIPDYSLAITKISQTGATTTTSVDTNFVTADIHHNTQIAVDGDGYIHIVYDMHHYGWRYMRSVYPEDISEWEFVGEFHGAFNYDIGNYDGESSTVEPKPEALRFTGYYESCDFACNLASTSDGMAAVPGNGITYPYMTTDKYGNIYISYRGCHYCDERHNEGSGELADRGIGIIRYDRLTRTWNRVGGNTSLAFDDQFLAVGAKLFFDENNRMHVSWMWGKHYLDGPESYPVNPAAPAYVYSDNQIDFYTKQPSGAVHHSPPLHHVEEGPQYAIDDYEVLQDWVRASPGQPVGCSSTAWNNCRYFSLHTHIVTSPNGATPYISLRPADPGIIQQGSIDTGYVTYNNGWSEEPILTAYHNTEPIMIDSLGHLFQASSNGSLPFHMAYRCPASTVWTAVNDLNLGWWAYLATDHMYVRIPNQVRFSGARGPFEDVKKVNLSIWTAQFTPPNGC